MNPDVKNASYFLNLKITNHDELAIRENLMKTSSCSLHFKDMTMCSVVPENFLRGGVLLKKDLPSPAE